MKAPKTTELPNLEALESALLRQWDVLFLAARRAERDSAAYEELVNAMMQTGRELAAVRRLREIAADCDKTRAA